MMSGAARQLVPFSCAAKRKARKRRPPWFGAMLHEFAWYPCAARKVWRLRNSRTGVWIGKPLGPATLSMTGEVCAARQSSPTAPNFAATARRLARDPRRGVAARGDEFARNRRCSRLPLQEGLEEVAYILCTKACSLLQPCSSDPCAPPSSRRGGAGFRARTVELCMRSFFALTVARPEIASFLTTVREFGSPPRLTEQRR